MADHRNRAPRDESTREPMEHDQVRGRAERDEEFDDDVEVIDDEDLDDEEEEGSGF